VTTTESLVGYERKRGQPRQPQGFSSVSLDTEQFSQRDARIPAQEVLFRRSGAPERFAEKDIYFANEELPDGGRGVLPDSDLLKSVHAYSSRFYEALGQRVGSGSFVGRRLVDERSMDETALLAMGILLEEAAREALGKSGDLVFTEGVDDSQTDQLGDEGKGEEPESETKREVTVGPKSDDDGFWRRKYPKRLKVAPREGIEADAL
jgi:hypothetical protein